ncbi:hypothetical protein ABOC32_24745 [Pseudomonas sp. WOUb67]|uniref:hypothetical protein n=1 Tax=Pseudomonas sp. WOUb67 TaxID=3161136 RepID=UPI003CEC495D
MSAPKDSKAFQEAETPGAPEVTDQPLLCVLGYIDEPVLNRLWAERYTRSGHDLREGEAVVVEREMNATTWELSVVNLGYPKLQFNTAGRTLQLSKKLLTDLRLDLSKPYGMAARQALRIEQGDSSSGKVLEVTLNLNSIHVEYHALGGSEVKVHWSTPATYVIQNDRVNADRFKQHYEALKQMKLAKLTIPVSPFLANTWVYFENRGDQLQPGFYNQPRQSTARFDPPQVSQNEEVALAFHIVAFPITLTQLPPVDKEWVVGLFAPRGSITWAYGAYLPPMEYYIAAYVASGAGQAQVTSATPAQALLLSPLVTFCDRGGPEEEVELMPVGAQATWAPEGTLRGELLSKDGKRYYKPPKSITPASEVRYKEGGDTLIPAALRSTLATPTATDIIKATAGGEAAYATFLIKWVHPTHFIRVAKHALGLKLSLCYFNWDSEEVAVPDRLASWEVVFGNGTITSGVFKAAVQNPSPYSIIVGVDKGVPDAWAWGLTIIAYPMLDIDTLVDYYSR